MARGAHFHHKAVREVLILTFRTINHIFKAYEPYKGAIDTGRNGSLISMAAGESSGYAIAPLQARGTMFIHPSIIGRSHVYMLCLDWTKNQIQCIQVW